ncbi:hypothetical protein [Streptomyces sp. NBC_01262]|uniref:hypothetical protein n=1 Tax=Streptomyces sp. NBC_01262 TaxID=2903803 RepID=UPI002E37F9FD|nr:hypothetical protein [Streptomyces sp. NBC_01262]
MTSTAFGQRLSGWAGDADYFVFREYDAYHPRAVVDVLQGKVAGVIFRNMVTQDTCAQLAARFWASPARKTRGSEAPGYYAGAYHYHKTTEDYLNESERTAAGLNELLDIPENPLTAFYCGLADALAEQNATVRLAQHGGRDACRGLLRSWHGQGQYALAPHDDISQCTEPKQADFEIQRVADHHATALNICLENGGGGRLAYWNIQPDEACRHRLGLHYTGSPYPLETLEGIEVKWIDVNAGDVYVFNGSHVHAVEPNTDPSLRRTTLAGLLGFIDDKTVVSWT